MIQKSNNILNNNIKDMDDSMSGCFLQLKVMHCKDLSAFNFFQKLLVYVVVTIESDDDPHKKLKDKDDPYHQHQQRTPTDAEGDANPEWNHPMRFDLSHVSSFHHFDHLFLRFDLRHEGLYFGDKSIGQVRVPLKDLLIQHQHQKDGGIVRFVSYEVRSMDGKPCGVLHFSYQANLDGTWSKDSPNHTTHSPSILISGYPMVGVDDHHYHHHKQQQQQQQQSNEIHCITTSSSSGVDSSSSPAEAYYPSLLDLEFNSQQLGTCSEHHHHHHQVHDDYQSLHLQGTPYPSQETRTSYYPPINAYYPPPPPLPPPPLMMHQPPPPPPPPMAYHGACYHPAGSHPWEPRDYNYTTMQGQSHHTSVNEVRWPPNDFRAGSRDGYY